MVYLLSLFLAANYDLVWLIYVLLALFPVFIMAISASAWLEEKKYEKTSKYLLWFILILFAMPGPGVK